MRIGRIIPWLIAVACVLDAGTRLIPLDMFAFRAWEVMVAGKADTGPFAPNTVYANPMSYGDLAGAPEHAHLRNYHPEYFSTDAWGFRNPAELSSAPPGGVGWMIVGDSFGVGSGVSDRDTLARQLEARVGTHVYSAAAGFPLRLRDLEYTANRLGMREGIVVFELMERVGVPSLASEQLPRGLSDGPPASKRWQDRLNAWTETADVSRLGILAGWAWGRLTANGASENGPILPVVEHRLSNGDPMLFLSDDVRIASDVNRRMPSDYLVWLDAQLARRHLQLVVLLVPNKYNVYGPHVTDAGAPRASTNALSELEQSLRSRGVAVVNVTNRLRREADAGLERHEYLYFPDDTHWNAEGIAVAAEALAEASRATRRR